MRCRKPNLTVKSLLDNARDLNQYIKKEPIPKPPRKDYRKEYREKGISTTKSLFSDNPMNSAVSALCENPKPFSQLYGRVNQKSLFSDKLDPTVPDHVARRYIDNDPELMKVYNIHRRKKLKKIEEINQMTIKRKEIALEAKDIQELARQYAPDAMQVLADIINNPEAADTAKITAANVILDRGYGKAAATNVNINTNMDAKPRELDSAEIDRRAAELIRKLEKEENKKVIDIRKYN